MTAAAACLVCGALVLAGGRRSGTLLWRWLNSVAGAAGRAPPRPTGPALELLFALLSGGAATVLGGPVAGVAGAVVAAMVRRGLGTARATRVAASRRSAEVELLAALASDLRAGRHPALALGALDVAAGGALHATLTEARAALALGGDVGAALRRGAHDAGSAIGRLAAAWQVSEGSGAPLADLLSRVEADVRAVARLHQSADVELAGARATGALLAALPLLGVVLGQAMGAAPVHALLHTPLGAGCVLSGLILEVAGLVWIGRLTRNALGPGR